MGRLGWVVCLSWPYFLLFFKKIYTPPRLRGYIICTVLQCDLPPLIPHCCCLGDGIHSIPCRTTDLAPGGFEEKDEQKNELLAEWMLQENDHLVHTIRNHHPPKMDVLPKTFLQIILAANWLGRYSGTSHNQQRRPLPSLLSVSSYMIQALAEGKLCFFLTSYIVRQERIYIMYIVQYISNCDLTCIIIYYIYILLYI